MKFSHRIVSVRYGRGRPAGPMALKFWLRYSPSTGELEMAADLEPRRWFSCSSSIAEIERMQGEDAGAILRDAVETALAAPEFDDAARRHPVLCACKFPVPIAKA